MCLHCHVHALHCMALTDTVWHGNGRMYRRHTRSMSFSHETAEATVQENRCYGAAIGGTLAALLANPGASNRKKSARVLRQNFNFTQTGLSTKSRLLRNQEMPGLLRKSCAGPISAGGIPTACRYPGKKTSFLSVFF